MAQFTSNGLNVKGGLRIVNKGGNSSLSFGNINCDGDFNLGGSSSNQIKTKGDFVISTKKGSTGTDLTLKGNIEGGLTLKRLLSMCSSVSGKMQIGDTTGPARLGWKFPNGRVVFIFTRGLELAGLSYNVDRELLNFDMNCWKLNDQQLLDYMVMNWVGAKGTGCAFMGTILKLQEYEPDTKPHQHSQVIPIIHASTKDKIYTEEFCVACQDVISDVVFKPCNHQCVCVGCFNILQSRTANKMVTEISCPICRSQLVSAVI
ncbi:Hypothetical protein HVR_LOCUS533 [uncultured virus]|nr:Hypothetical protein HVR_LOCUS533 [uncultured virus]